MLALLLVVSLPQSARASFIDLVSQSYHIAASGVGYGPSTGLELTYDETSDTPLMRQDQMSLSDGGFNLVTNAFGGVVADTAFVYASSWAFDAGTAFASYANADAALTFRPLVSNVVVHPAFLSPTRPPVPYRGTVSLYDNTAGLTLLALAPVMTDATYVFALDSTHLYTVSASAHSASNSRSDAALSLTPGPASVPESDRTLTFFVVGLGAVLLVARSQTFRPSN